MTAPPTNFGRSALFVVTVTLAFGSLVSSGCQPFGMTGSLVLSAEDAALAAAAAARRADRARSLERRGALARALSEWRTVAALEPQSREAAGAIARLDESVRENADARTSEARAALARGQRSTATTAALRALALDPSHDEAQAVLRDLESEQVVRSRTLAPIRLARNPDPGNDDSVYVRAQTTPGDAQLAAAATAVSPGLVTRGAPSETAVARARSAGAPGVSNRSAGADAGSAGAAGAPQTSTTAASGTPENAPQARKLTAAREAIEAGQAARARGELDRALRQFERAVALTGDRRAQAAAIQLRSELAERYYAEGVRAFRTDVDGAISALERSVQYDPGHTQAQLKLLAARETRERLAQLQ
ncbi:MAG: tetratricopeptide repeat protein [Gammaproteobacteria bacterium]